MTNAIAYIRVSTDGQASEDKFGLESQRQLITEYASKHDYNIIEWYEDEGESGAKMNRPEFDKIIFGEVYNPPCEVVLVAKNDRIARDINIYFYYKMLLLQKNIKLISISEDFGMMGPFAGILEAFTMMAAEMERTNITKRTSGGRRVKAKQGGYSGGAAPYGYKVVEGRLIIDEVEAAAVRDIFEMSAKGSILQVIADEMNSRGLVTHRGGIFRTSTIQTILANKRTYQGEYKYGDTDWRLGQHEAILTEN